MNARECAAAVRSGAGLFGLSGDRAGAGARATLRVTGSERVRWLNGMVSNDVASLAPGAERSGCHASLLTPKGGVVADLHVLLRPDALWLDVPAAAAAAVRARLERYIVADDVAVGDASDEHERLGIEGPAAAAILEAAGPGALPGPDAALEREVAGVPVVVAGYGWSGEAAFQLFVPVPQGATARRGLVECGAALGLVECGASGPEALEILRVEAGVPRFGAELRDEVLPDEARLGGTIALAKGCYTGQEIVARLRSRGRVNHLLVGLRFEDAAPPAPLAEVRAGGRRTGEVTSACRSPRAGTIALAFVRREHAVAGAPVEVEGRAGRVADLPFVAPASRGGPAPASREER